jgi:hypothetical protein
VAAKGMDSPNPRYEKKAETASLRCAFRAVCIFCSATPKPSSTAITGDQFTSMLFSCEARQADDKRLWAQSNYLRTPLAAPATGLSLAQSRNQ